MLQVNPVKERLLFLSPVVQAGWEKEATIADFEKMADLGQGAFGLVSKVKHKKSQIIYAVKQMDKKRLKLSGMIDQIRTEIKIMYSLSHENIVKLFNHFEDDDHIYLVIDYAPGGQLWDKMQKAPGKRLSEKESAQYVKDLVSSLEYLHGKGIIHRDIKPENLLIDGKGHLKLADFGWSNYFKSDAQRTTFCGTLDYLAPEMLESGHQHDHMVDIWAIGVLIYELLTGKSPFSPTNPLLKMKDIERSTQNNIVAVTYEIPKDFPPLAKDLVSKILRKNPRTRLNLSEIKSHPWVKCTAFVVKKKELDPQALIDAITFGQNMADQKKFAQADLGNYGFKPAFTEEEIIQYAKPDSMLDRAQYGFTAATKTINLDKQIAEFRLQMGITSQTSPKIETGLIGLTPTNTTTPYNMTSFSAISEEASPTSAKDLEYKLRIKSDECNLLQQEVDKLRRSQDSFSLDRVRVLEQENASLKNQVSDLHRRLSEKEAAIGSYTQSEDMRIKIVKLEEQLAREKHYYESKINELEFKLTHGGGMSPSYSTDSSSGKVKEVQEINENLAAQIAEYTKLIGRLYENSPFDVDTEKKRMLEDIKTLRSLSSIKQDRIERLEAKMKSHGI